MKTLWIVKVNEVNKSNRTCSWSVQKIVQSTGSQHLWNRRPKGCREIKTNIWPDFKLKDNFKNLGVTRLLVEKHLADSLFGRQSFEPIIWSTISFYTICLSVKWFSTKGRGSNTWLRFSGSRRISSEPTAAGCSTRCRGGSSSSGGRHPGLY